MMAFQTKICSQTSTQPLFEMKKIFIYPALLILVLLIGCGETKQELELSTSAISDYLKPETQSFNWSTNKDTLFTCKNGTMIYLPKGSIDHSSDSLNVTVDIKEYYSLSDFISEGLTTVSKEGILETGGMLNIKIHENGKKLKLKKDFEYAVYFPKNGNTGNSMNTFYGSRNSNGQITWAQKNDPEENDETPLDLEQFIECQFYTSSRTSAIGGEKVSWELKSTKDFVPDYIEQNLKPSKKMVSDFCALNLNPRYDIQFDKTGKVKDIKIDTKSTNKYDSIICDFILNMPNIDMATMPKCCPDFYYTLGFGGWERQIYDAETYNNKFKSKYSQFKEKAVSKVDKAELNYFVLTASQFGWINCDRFWDINDEKIDFVVSAKDYKELNLNLIFSDINSIMQATKVDDKYVFNDVPINRKIKLVGIGYEGDQIKLSENHTVISNEEFELSDFKKFSLTDLEKALNSI